MKLWISGEMDSILSDSFRVTRNYVEQNVNNILISKSYGEGISSWDIIMIVSKDKGKEVYKYNKKNKETDIRIIVDIDKFKSSNSLGKKMLLLDALIYSLNKLMTLNIPDFDYLDLKRDLLNLKEVIFNQYGN
jgi:hypothetical protein